MTRTALLAATLLGIAGLAAPADAKVVSKKTGQDPDAVRAYWTAERMANARPADRARGGEPREARKPGTNTSSSWSTLQVNWANAPAETTAHGKVFFTENGWNYVCSGTAVTSSSESVVWTAGHCVHDGANGFATNWSFVPAYNSQGKVEPYGKWVGVELATTDAWAADGEFGHDLGAVRVATNGGVSLRDAIGTSRDLAIGTLTQNTRVNAYGYPAAGKFNGQSLYVCDTYISRIDSSTTPDAYGIPCGMTGGSSGGGWVNTTGDLVSVVSYGYQSLKNHLFGPRHDAAASALLTQANS